MRYPRLAALYLPFIDAVKEGNVRAFDDTLSVPAVEKLLIGTGTYLAVERAREICLRGLIKRVHRCKDKSSRIALADFHRALLFVGVQLDLLETEWLIASQIAKVSYVRRAVTCRITSLTHDFHLQGYVKGYISHPHMTAVLSNQEPFPHLADVAVTM